MDLKNPYILGGGALAVTAVFLLTRDSGSDSAPAEPAPVANQPYFLASAAPAYTGDGSTLAGEGSTDWRTAVVSAAGYGPDGASAKLYDVMLSAIDSQKEVALAQNSTFASVGSQAVQEALLKSVIGRIQKNQGAFIQYDENGRITGVENREQTTAANAKKATDTAFNLYNRLNSIYAKQAAANVKAQKAGLPLPYPDAKPPAMPSSAAPLLDSKWSGASGNYSYITAPANPAATYHILTP